MGIDTAKPANKRLPATHADLLEVCKAMRDHMRESLAASEGEIGLRLGKAIETRFDKAFGESLSKSIEGYLGKRLEELKAEQDERVEFLRRSYEEGLARIERLLTNLQIPQPQILVQVPELIIPPASVTVAPAEVFLPPASVVVNVPEQMLPAPVANFVLPDLQLPAPVVNVAAAEIKSMPAPVVNVSMPRRKMRKTISYLADGRPGEIIEEEIEATE